MSKEKSKSEMGKGVHSPSNREETIQNCGGMPPKKSAEEILDNNQPPKRYAEDSTKGIGRP